MNRGAPGGASPVSKYGAKRLNSPAWDCVSALSPRFWSLEQQAPSKGRMTTTTCMNTQRHSGCLNTYTQLKRFLNAQILLGNNFLPQISAFTVKECSFLRQLSPTGYLLPRTRKLHLTLQEDANSSVALRRQSPSRECKLMIINYIKISVFILTVLCMGCAANRGSQNAVDTVDNSLATAEQAAQTGQRALESGVAATGNVSANQASLADILVSQLDVSQQQALGGAGAIFQTAKANMEPQEFETLSRSVPGMGDMLSAAPTISNPTANAAGNISSIINDANSALGSIGALASSFQLLNLSPNMVGQFIPIMTNYVETNGGQMMADLLQSALAAP